MNKVKILIGAVAILFASASNAVIIGAIDGTINSGGPGFGSLADTYNQNGLSATYTSGITDFDSFVSTTHSYIFSGNEWWSNQGTTTASVTYDLGSVMNIDKMALWNEDAVGIGSLDLLTSSDGINFSSLLSNLSPTENLVNFDYTADVFDFSATSFQYITLDMSGCAAANEWTFDACAIGEVAFNTASVSEPSTFALLAVGLLGVGFARKKAKK